MLRQYFNSKEDIPPEWGNPEGPTYRPPPEPVEEEDKEKETLNPQESLFDW